MLFYVDKPGMAILGRDPGSEGERHWVFGGRRFQAEEEQRPRPRGRDIFSVCIR